jgi:hypothetical protein
MANTEQTCQLIVDILNEHMKEEVDHLVGEYLCDKISLDELAHNANIITSYYEFRITAVRNKYFYPRVEK